MEGAVGELGSAAESGTEGAAGSAREGRPASQHFGPPERLNGVRPEVIPVARSILIRLGLIGLVFLLVEIVLPAVLAAVTG